MTKRLTILAFLVITVLLIGGGCEPSNQLPVISSLTADQEAIELFESCQIECTASDPNGDTLSFHWLVDGGSISGEGPIVTWIPPEAPGAYLITVEVSDNKDGIDIEHIIIEVLAPNQLPVIENLSTDCPRVRPAATATIACIASDPDEDELTYTWSAEAGNISGEGNIVTFVAPNDYGTYLITVTVTDGRGGQVSESLEIIVCSCGSACE